TLELDAHVEGVHVDVGDAGSVHRRDATTAPGCLVASSTERGADVTASSALPGATGSERLVDRPHQDLVHVHVRWLGEGDDHGPGDVLGPQRPTGRRVEERR